MTTSTLEASIAELSNRFSGPLIGRRDGAYDEARRVWNGMIDKRPVLIARCRGVTDVITGVKFAREHGLTIAVRGGGHNVAGFSTCDDGLVLDLSLMKGIEVDPEKRVARAQAGALWEELDHETQAFGLATTGGLVSETGIAGLTLGGGIGWLMRKYGLTCDNLLSADLVTADGRLLKASPEQNADLFWALRGGGGNFGVVTSFEFQLHPLGPVVAGGAAFYPAERAGELLRFYREWTATQPDELTTMVAFLTAPPEPFIPPELQHKPAIAVALCYAGPIEDGMRAVEPLKAAMPPAVDLVGPMPYVALQKMFNASAPRGIHSYWKTSYARSLSDDAISVLESGADAAQSPFSAIHIHHVEGAVARVAADSTAVGNRDVPFIVNVIGLWQPGDAAPHVSWVRDVHKRLEPFAGGGAYLNFMDRDEAARVPASYGANYSRLASIKGRYDADNLFSLNQNIKPG